MSEHILETNSPSTPVGTAVWLLVNLSVCASNGDTVGATVGGVLLASDPCPPTRRDVTTTCAHRAPADTKFVTLLPCFWMSNLVLFCFATRAKMLSMGQRADSRSLSCDPLRHVFIEQLDEYPQAVWGHRVW